MAYARQSFQTAAAVAGGMGGGVVGGDRGGGCGAVGGEPFARCTAGGYARPKPGHVTDGRSCTCHGRTPGAHTRHAQPRPSGHPTGRNRRGGGAANGHGRAWHAVSVLHRTRHPGTGHTRTAHPAADTRTAAPSRTAGRDGVYHCSAVRRVHGGDHRGQRAPRFRCHQRGTGTDHPAWSIAARPPWVRCTGVSVVLAPTPPLSRVPGDARRQVPSMPPGPRPGSPAGSPTRSRGP